MIELESFESRLSQVNQSFDDLWENLNSSLKQICGIELIEYFIQNVKDSFIRFIAVNFGYIEDLNAYVNVDKGYNGLFIKSVINSTDYTFYFSAQNISIVFDRVKYDRITYDYVKFLDRINSNTLI